MIWLMQMNSFSVDNLEDTAKQLQDLVDLNITNINTLLDIKDKTYFGNWDG